MNCEWQRSFALACDPSSIGSGPQDEAGSLLLMPPFGLAVTRRSRTGSGLRTRISDRSARMRGGNFGGRRWFGSLL
jgi:hypothetical protein